MSLTAVGVIISALFGLSAMASVLVVCCLISGSRLDKIRTTGS